LRAASTPDAARTSSLDGVSQALPTPITEQPEPRISARSVAERFQGMLFIAPALAVLGVFLIYPAYYTIRLAFYKSDFFYHFKYGVGFDNFKNLLWNDPDFLDHTKFHGFNIVRELLYKNDSGALINNLHWVVYYITIALGLGLLLAVMAARVRYERAVKSIVFVPMAISATAASVIWLSVYNQNINVGVLNAFIHAIDHGFSPIAWVGRPSTVNWALIWAYIWASTGFAMVVLSAAIKGIPAEILEAARVDGANEVQIFRRVMLPMLSLPISIVAVWLFVNVIKLFDIIYVMTGGGPGTSSRVIAFSMWYETFFNGHAGYGAAVAVVMLILIAPVMVLNVRRFRSERVVA
jgi:alpha-glucoside transport system permease protein